jgi:hypothetical protein
MDDVLTEPCAVTWQMANGIMTIVGGRLEDWLVEVFRDSGRIQQLLLCADSGFGRAFNHSYGATDDQSMRCFVLGSAVISERLHYDESSISCSKIILDASAANSTRGLFLFESAGGRHVRLWSRRLLEGSLDFRAEVLHGKEGRGGPRTLRLLL